MEDSSGMLVQLGLFELPSLTCPTWMIMALAKGQINTAELFSGGCIFPLETPLEVDVFFFRYADFSDM